MRDSLAFVMVVEGRGGVWGVRPLVVLPGEGGGVGVDRVCGGGHGYADRRKVDRCRQRGGPGKIHG